jgi:hypothetical protein
MEYLSKIPGEEMAQITVDRNEVTNMATLLKKLSNASG